MLIGGQAHRIEGGVEIASERTRSSRAEEGRFASKAIANRVVTLAVAGEILENLFALSRRSGREARQEFERPREPGLGSAIDIAMTGIPTQVQAEARRARASERMAMSE